jgi:NAD(P)-dependent dehydrogenase (short-subunit alcohol dehydrogenase family)
MTRYELAGQTVAVTGGARGIGLAIARACSEAGMSVAIGDLSEAASAEAAQSLPGQRADWSWTSGIAPRSRPFSTPPKISSDRCMRW